MDSRKLRVFQSVARLQSFSQAAEQLHIAQSAVSAAIAKLEAELGLQLFERLGRQIRLSVEGERLLVHADQVLQQLDAAEREMRQLADKTAGIIRFSTTAMMGQYFFPDKIQAFVAQNPGITYRMLNQGTAGVIAQISSGEIDMGVVNSANMPSELTQVALGVEPILVCMSPTHPLATKTYLTPADCVCLDWIVYRENYYLRQLVDQMHAQQGLAAKIALESDLLGVILAMVRQNLGVALGLGCMLAQETDLVGIPLKPAQTLELSIGWRADRTLSLANQAFVDFLSRTALKHSS